VRLFFQEKISVGRSWEFRIPFSPYEEFVRKSAHLRSGTALTDEGLLLGNMAFGSVLSRLAWIANFEPRIRSDFACSMMI
jgi:hypothetical protein